MTIYAVHKWTDNGQLILGLRQLGYLRGGWHTLDPTYGEGTFWKHWQPRSLVAHDLITDGVDFRQLPEAAGTFDAVTFDPPYKLNGTASPSVDARYGLHEYQSRDGRHELMRLGMAECARVLKFGGYLSMKCMDQVNGGKVRWQTRMFADYGEEKLGLELVDMLHFVGGREQPKGVRQVHARRNYSSLLVFQKRSR